MNNTKTTAKNGKHATHDKRPSAIKNVLYMHQPLPSKELGGITVLSLPSKEHGGIRI